MRVPKYVLYGYCIFVSVILFLFSYTQVDLNLTLSRAGFIPTIQKAFQSVGYYNRPAATSWYVLIVASLFFFQLSLLYMAGRKQIVLKDIIRCLAILAGILFFSYPAAFSYDFFNYMFTAKSVLVYRQNPYAFVPLALSGFDPWLTFMRWTHLPSAYTPLWIGMTLVPYLVGFGYFIGVMFSLKLLVYAFYGAACFLIYTVTERTEPEHKEKSLILFAFNPLIIIETLVSAHNDIVMAAFALGAVWFLFREKRYAAFGMLSLSVAVKLMTAFLVPVFIWTKNRKLMLVALCMGLLLVLMRREFLPWYWVWIVPFMALLPGYALLQGAGLAVSAGLLLRYAPYFYFGDYNVPTQMWRTVLFWVPIVIAFVWYLIARERKPRPSGRR